MKELSVSFSRSKHDKNNFREILGKKQRTLAKKHEDKLLLSLPVFFVRHDSLKLLVSFQESKWDAFTSRGNEEETPKFGETRNTFSQQLSN